MTDALFDREPAGGALVVGCGGGGDVVQTIPVVNYLRRLGVERFVVGEIAIKWWDRPGRVPLGGERTPLEWYEPATRHGPHVVEIDASTRLTAGIGAGAPLFEAEVARVTGLPAMAFSLDGGCRGFVDSCRAVMAAHALDLFVTVDIGADAFFTGEETTVQSPLADACSIAAAVALDGVYGVTGFGCDAEMPAAHLQRNVARVMADGGYLGAHGLTPTDVAALSDALTAFPDEEVEIWPRDAARGRLGTHFCKTWWAIEVTPLAAITMFFDPAALARINPIPGLIEATESLAAVEQAILDGTCLVPETRLPEALQIPTEPCA